MDKNIVVDILTNGDFVGKDNEYVDNSFMFSVKLIGIYFSAHWCPPCKAFTPVLADFYKQVNKDEKQMEIIFASCDRDEQQFNDYFNEMPWISLPFGDSRIETLSDIYNCQGIPYLVVIQPDGTVVSTKGRNDVGSKGVKAFDYWIGKLNAGPFDAASALSTKVLGKDLKDAHFDFKSNKLIGLYFSAHWCPPCRGFTPELAKFYNQVNANGKQLEIIFVSCDRDEKQFKEYFHEMPWLSLPFKDERVKDLSEVYECEGIPHLVILRPDSSVVTLKGRDDVYSLGEGAINKWLQ